jgi:hypothetical protein
MTGFYAGLKQSTALYQIKSDMLTGNRFHKVIILFPNIGYFIKNRKFFISISNNSIV